MSVVCFSHCTPVSDAVLPHNTDMCALWLPWSQRQLLSCMRGGNCPGPNVSSSQLPGDVSFFANQLAVPTVEFAFEQSKDDEVGPPKPIWCGHSCLVNKGPLDHSLLPSGPNVVLFEKRTIHTKFIVCCVEERSWWGICVIVETHSYCLSYHLSSVYYRCIRAKLSNILFPWHFHSHFIKYVMHSVSLKLE